MTRFYLKFGFSLSFPSLESARTELESSSRVYQFQRRSERKGPLSRAQPTFSSSPTISLPLIFDARWKGTNVVKQPRASRVKKERARPKTRCERERETERWWVVKANKEINAIGSRGWVGYY